jgi:putative endonuclease
VSFWKRFVRSARPSHIVSGEWGEREAGRHLKSKGWKVLGLRVREANREEIDIVARDGDVLVFVEVKTRASESFGRPIESVDRKKRELLCKAAARYLVKLKDPRIFYRFDVIEVIGTPKEGVSELRHVENAFPMDRRYSI